MPSLGFANPDLTRQNHAAGGGGAPLAYLPPLATSGAAYHAIYSNERLLAEYDGPLAAIGNGVSTVSTRKCGSR